MNNRTDTRNFDQFDRCRSWVSFLIVLLVHRTVMAKPRGTGDPPVRKGKPPRADKGASQASQASEASVVPAPDPDEAELAALSADDLQLFQRPPEAA